MYSRDVFIIQPEWFIYPSNLKSVSQHVRASSFPRWATFLLSLPVWTQLPVGTQIHSSFFPFLFPSTPNYHVPAPTLNLSFNPPLSVADFWTFTPVFFPFSSYCPTLLSSSAHDNSFIPHSADFCKHLSYSQQRRLPLNHWTLLYFNN